MRTENILSDDGSFQQPEHILLGEYSCRSLHFIDASSPPEPTVAHEQMSKWTSRVITAISFPFGPGITVVLLPFVITRFNEGAPLPSVVRIIGVILIALSGILMVSTFARFAREGQGSPFPTNPPTSRLVMKDGPYRYVRNPMYVSFYICLIGEVLLLNRPVLLIYDAALIVALFVFVRFYEQRTMTKRFGAEYVAYCQRVPGWWPRWPWRAG